MRTAVPTRGWGGTAGRAASDLRIGPTRSVGPGRSVVAVSLVAQVHRLLQGLAGEGGLVEGAVLVHRRVCLPRPRGPLDRGVRLAPAERCLGEPVSDAAGSPRRGC